MANKTIGGYVRTSFCKRKKELLLYVDRDSVAGDYYCSRGIFPSTLMLSPTQKRKKECLALYFGIFNIYLLFFLFNHNDIEITHHMS